MKSNNTTYAPKPLSEEVLDTEIEPILFQALNTLGEPDPSNITKQDVLSAMAFDKHGELLSVGDRGGRVIVFHRVENNGVMDFEYLAEFQSHEITFDPLNSNQIPEKINAIEWINPYASSLTQLLSANDKLIKLWRIDSHKEKKYDSARKHLLKGRLVLPRSKVVSE